MPYAAVPAALEVLVERLLGLRWWGSSDLDRLGLRVRKHGIRCSDESDVGGFKVVHMIHKLPFKVLHNIHILPFKTIGAHSSHAYPAERAALLPLDPVPRLFGHRLAANLTVWKVD